MANISSMLTITRLHNTISAIGGMRRYYHTHYCCVHNFIILFCIIIHSMIMLSRDYSTKREAFGKFLADHPLHMKTLAEMEVS